MPRPYSIADLFIRVATEDDLARVSELAVDLVITSRSAHRDEVTDEEIRDYRRRNFEQLSTVLEMPEGGLFVANDPDGRHVGHVLLLGNQFDPISEMPQAWVYDVSVQRDWWGKGVGKLLMDTAELFAKNLGLGYIGLGVTEANARAVDFYKRLGYDVERVQMVKKLESPT